ncbi:YLP motif-containing protein 1-like isoform X1 [Euwallacea similis]|uniref:YLP motif-containing protein 1-like isoform X1 n=1 Tax=Euwallacea similis TaxID=1736056 RepID=UPI003450A0C1
MSWPAWHTSTAPSMGVVPAPIQSTIMPATVNPTPVVAPHPQAAASLAATAIQYSPEQWAQMQQQNWQQWAQWQQQYQQWHQQYGAEYQKSLNALSASTPNTTVPPPPPNENKPPPPPPPDENKPYPVGQTRISTGYTTVPLPTQQYTGSGPQLSTQHSTQASLDWQAHGVKRSLPQSNENNKRQMSDNPIQWTNRQNQNLRSTNTNASNWQSTPLSSQTQAQKVLNLEELTEAEKKFDKEFAAWEAQFNKWKDQNANHPDKTQYMEYEKKWESWRNSLLDRREQMRKKRTALQASMVVTSKVAAPPAQQNFSQPPPQLPQGFQSQTSPVADNLFSKPPPTQNNEHLAFKQPPPDLSINISTQNDGTPEAGDSFLKSSSPTPGGIPGLDLVKAGGLGQDNGDDFPPDATKPESDTTKGPDYDAISKGINSILGDSKLMNILSMVSQNQNIASGASVDSLPMNINFSQPPPSSNVPIPSLLNMPMQRPNFERSSQSFEDYPDSYSNPSQVVESVNNFDDQTRMSFSNGPNDQEVNFSPNIPPPARADFNNFRRGSNRHMRGLKQHNGSSVEHNVFAGKDGFDGPFRNSNGPSSFNRNSQFGNAYALYNKREQNQHFEQYEEEDNEKEWNEEEEYDKYHDMFNDGEQFEIREEAVVAETVQPQVQEGPLFVPEVVVDYEHKSLKEPEPEIALQMLRMFDYRHKPVNRIPYPQRPIWLSSSLRNIKQFDPLGSGRFNAADVASAYERGHPRYPPDRNDKYIRRNNSFLDNSSEDRSLSSRDKDYGRDRPRSDYSSVNRSRDYRRESSDRGGLRSEPSVESNVRSKLELEDLSDDEWGEEDNQLANNKRTLKFSPPRNVNNQVSFPHNAVNHSTPVAINQNLTLEDLINPPGRFSRPSKIVLILRGPPGSGKTYLAKLLKDREVENGGSAPRILSLDDYFMVEYEKEVVEEGKVIKVKEMTYEYEAEMEGAYQQSLIKSFKKTVTDGYFHFIVVDNINQKVRNFGEMWSFAKQNGFQVYICQLDLDPELCTRRNIHHRTESYVEDCIAGWEPTPSHHPQVDPTTFMQSSGPISEVEMEEVEQSFEPDDDMGEEQVRSKWDSFDCSLNNLARLDGVSRPLRPSRTMEEYLQMDNEWEERNQPTKPGQKRVRWADLEEQKQQQKMKALGFVVGHTDWNRMMDPTNGESALRQTKFIESRYK